MQGVDQVHEDVVFDEAVVLPAVHLAVVVFDELLDEGTVLLEQVVTHVGDVVKDRLVLHLGGGEELGNVDELFPFTLNIYF